MALQDALLLHASTPEGLVGHGHHPHPVLLKTEADEVLGQGQEGVQQRLKFRFTIPGAHGSSQEVRAHGGDLEFVGQLL